jgi:hypothetical protein
LLILERQTNVSIAKRAIGPTNFVTMGFNPWYPTTTNMSAIGTNHIIGRNYPNLRPNPLPDPPIAHISAVCAFFIGCSALHFVMHGEGGGWIALWTSHTAIAELFYINTMLKTFCAAMGLTKEKCPNAQALFKYLYFTIISPA